MNDPMSADHPMSADVTELFRWRAKTDGTWTEAAEQARRLLAQVEAGQMSATPAELAALRTFVATVEGMAGMADRASLTHWEPFVYSIGMGKRLTADRTRPLALAYVRVSTTEQAEDGASLTAQRDALTAEAARRGWDVEVIADQGYSAKSVEARPGLVAALARLDAGQADALMVVRVDRLSRSVGDFAALMARAKRRAWALVALDLGVDTSTPAGDLMANVLASVAQYERLVIGQRTREGMAVRKAEGVHVGRARSLPEDVVARIVTERAAGLGPTAIARKLNEAAVATAHGATEWRASSVAAVLRSTTARRLAGRPA